MNSDYTLIRSQATDLAQSGFWKDARKDAEAIAKVMAGQELGIPPVMAMSQVQIIQGRPALGAGAIAGLVKGSGKYRYQQLRHDDQVCELEFFERVDGAWVSVGTSSFSMADAKRSGLAGKDIWRKYPRNMLFARAISNGARWYCPDVFHGSIYTPEELDDEKKPQHPQQAQIIDVTPMPASAGSDDDIEKAVQWGVDKGAFSSLDLARNAFERIRQDAIMGLPAGQPVTWEIIKRAWVAEVKAICQANQEQQPQLQEQPDPIEVTEDGHPQADWTEGERKRWQKHAKRLYAVCAATGADKATVRQDIIDRHEQLTGEKLDTTLAIRTATWVTYVNETCDRLEGKAPTYEAQAAR